MSTQRDAVSSRQKRSRASSGLPKNRTAAKLSWSASTLVAIAVTPLALSHITHLLVRSYAPIWGDVTDHLFRPSWTTALFVSSLAAGCIVSGSASTFADQSSRLYFLGTVWLAIIPIVSYSILFNLSLTLGPSHGPAVYNGLLICPLLISATLTTFFPTRDMSLLTKALLMLAYLSIYLLSGSTAWWRFLRLEAYLGHNPYSVLCAWMGLASLSFFTSRRNSLVVGPFNLLDYLVLTILVVILVLLWPPQSRDGITTSYAAKPPSDFRLLDRTFSITGALSVAEHRINDRWIRYLRCDHSLLGGVWLDPGISDMAEMESIYTAIYLQEAIRFVQGSVADDGASALFVGLGVGTAVTGLQQHGIEATTVEIDPAVVTFAQTYFGLKSDSVHVMDARLYLSQSNATFDYIVHDIFTGGAMPLKLLTQESWKDVKVHLATNGVLAVNFAGDPDSEIAQRVVATLLAAFKHCRAYRDIGESKSRHVNMVIFCSSRPVYLRQAGPTD